MKLIEFEWLATVFYSCDKCGYQTRLNNWGNRSERVESHLLLYYLKILITELLIIIFNNSIIISTSFVNFLTLKIVNSHHHYFLSATAVTILLKSPNITRFTKVIGMSFNGGTACTELIIKGWIPFTRVGGRI